MKNFLEYWKPTIIVAVVLAISFSLLMVYVNTTTAGAKDAVIFTQPGEHTQPFLLVKMSVRDAKASLQDERLQEVVAGAGNVLDDLEVFPSGLPAIAFKRWNSEKNSDELAFLLPRENGYEYVPDHLGHTPHSVYLALRWTE